MTINQALIFAEKKLENFARAAEEAEILLAAALHKNREYLLAHPDEKISFWRNLYFRKMINKRTKGYSSAAVTGHKWFYDLDYIVNNHVLIPRPETELMIDEILRSIKKEELRIKNLIDIGTGCGCIIVVLAKKLPLLGINFYGLDISRQALSVARRNAQKHKVEKDIKFIKSDLLREIFKRKISPGPTIITANLPYLTAEQIAASPSIKKEPRLALIGGRDGLDCYRRLFSQIKNHRQFFKGELLIFCEIDEAQKSAIEKLIKEEFPRARQEIKKDLGGAERLAIIKL